jgi:ATP-dependent Clp protease adaptor protein ClpS
MSSPDERKPPDTRRDRKESVDVLERPRVQRPPMFKVLFHNDDYTTRDFVVMVLMRFFHKTQSEATHVMLHIHHNGFGIAGVYPRDVAETKKRQVEALAREYEYPLRLSIEPEGGRDRGEDP